MIIIQNLSNSVEYRELKVQFGINLLIFPKPIHRQLFKRSFKRCSSFFVPRIKSHFSMRSSLLTLREYIKNFISNGQCDKIENKSLDQTVPLCSDSVPLYQCLQTSTSSYIVPSFSWNIGFQNHPATPLFAHPPFSPHTYRRYKIILSFLPPSTMQYSGESTSSHPPVTRVQPFPLTSIQIYQNHPFRKKSRSYQWVMLPTRASRAIYFALHQKGFLDTSIRASSSPAE